MAVDIQAKISAAKAAGYSDEDIVGHFKANPVYGLKIERAEKLGYSAADIVNYANSAQQPEPQPEQQTATQEPLTWGVTAAKAVINVPKGLATAAKGYYNALAHPLDTAKSVVDLGAGALYNVLPESVVSFINQFETNPEAAARAVQIADAVGGEFKKYGSIEGFKQKLAEDPVSVAMDFSMLASAGAGASGRLGSGATQKALSTAARVSNPMNSMLPAAKLAAKVVTAPIKGVSKAAYRAVLEPQINPGAIKTRALYEAVGGAENAPAAIRTLRETKPSIPGTQLSAGEALVPLGRPEVAALQKQMYNVAPAEYLARSDTQKAARVAQIRSVGKTEGELAAAKAARSAQWTKDFAAVEGQTVKVTPELRKLMARGGR